MNEDKPEETKASDCQQRFNGVFLAASIGLLLVLASHMFAHIASLPNSDSVEDRKLSFAYGVLFAIGFLLALASAFYVFVPGNNGNGESPAKSVFESFIKVLVPIATLVLGYYFGTSQQAPEAKKPLAPPAQQTSGVPAKS